MSVNYFKLIGALAYIVLITTLKGIVFDILTHPLVTLAIALPYVVAIALRNFSKGQINKIILTIDTMQISEDDLTP